MKTISKLLSILILATTAISIDVRAMEMDDGVDICYPPIESTETASSRTYATYIKVPTENLYS